MKRTPFVCDRCGADLETPYHMSFWSTVGELNIKGAAEKDLCEGCAREVAAYAEAKIRPLARGEVGHTPATKGEFNAGEMFTAHLITDEEMTKTEKKVPKPEQKVPKASGYSTKPRNDVNEETIARLMAEGKNRSEIASELNCSIYTVNRRISRMKEQQQAETEKQPERTETDRPAGKVMKRKEIDIDSGKVIALKKAGWDAVKIASECRTEAWVINNILFSAEEKGVDLSPNDTKNRALEWNDNNDETCMTMGNVVSGTTVLNQWAEY